MSTYVFAQTVGLEGAVPTYATADVAGNTFEPGDRTFIHLLNDQAGSAAASITATVVDPNSIALRASTAFDPNVTIVVAPGSSEFRGPFPASRFADSVTGYVTVEYDDVTDVSVGIFTLNPPGL